MGARRRPEYSGLWRTRQGGNGERLKAELGESGNKE